MSKCRYCGKEYDGGGLWDDGFCCGRCRSLARSRNVGGKTPRGCLYIILIIVAFMLLIFLFSPFILKQMEKHVKSEKQKTEIKRSKKKEKKKISDYQVKKQNKEQGHAVSEVSSSGKSEQVVEENNSDISKEERASEEKISDMKQNETTTTNEETEFSK
ncbi:hypothetical protein [Hoylesella loescheii]|uniref:hypothetical protein n=1 Tax=Hoylesella loescheii TaxID=840 RepID=UPI001E6270A4|nr:MULTISPECIES: hypothetical protein [Prevotellaceae]